MKFPRTLLMAALSVAAVITTSCGGGGGSSTRIQQPPPPPTGTNYTTCNGQQVPNWQSSAFQTPYKSAISAFVANYSSNPKVGYMRIGLGKGGEINLPQGWNDSGSGACYGGYSGTWNYTVGGSTMGSSNWNTYLGGMVNYEASLNSAKPLLVSITPITGENPSTATDDFIAQLATSDGISFGNQGLEASDITNFPNCGGDWCNLFATYHPAIAELQTLGQSCPSGSCSNNLSNNTGPLPPLLPFAIQHGGNDLEIYYQDWLIAYDPAYANAAGVDAATALAYQQAIHAAAQTPGVNVQVLFPPQSTGTDYSAVQNYLMNNPDVTGAVISVEWSDIEPSQGSFNFAITDAVIAPWIAAGKQVNLVFENTTYGGNGCPPSGIGSNGNVGSNCAMPSWMWTALQ